MARKPKKQRGLARRRTMFERLTQTKESARLFIFLFGLTIMIVATLLGVTITLMGSIYVSLFAIVLALRFVLQVLDSLESNAHYRRIVRDPIIKTIRQLDLPDEILAHVEKIHATPRLPYWQYRHQISKWLGDLSHILMIQDSDIPENELAERYVLYGLPASPDSKRRHYSQRYEGRINWGELVTDQLTLTEKNGGQVPLPNLAEVLAAQEDLSWSPGVQQKMSRFIDRGLPEDKGYKSYLLRKIAPIIFTVPVYRMTEEEIRGTIESFTWQNLLPYRVYIVLNDNQDDVLKKAIPRIISEQPWPGMFEFYIQPKRGKRSAMNMGWRLGLGMSAYTNTDKVQFPELYELFPELFGTQFSLKPLQVPIRFQCHNSTWSQITVDFDIIYAGNVDGDGLVDEDAILNAYKVMEADQTVLATTGSSQIRNQNENDLTKQTMWRYLDANHGERGAQSKRKQVICMTGPFMMVRAKYLRKVLRQWSRQRFAGVDVHVGDDRRLTKLFNLKGWGVVMIVDSVVWTESPTIINPDWLNQQTRWSRSAAREFILDYYEWASRMAFIIVFQQHYSFLFPYILIGVVTSLSVNAVILGVRVAGESGALAGIVAAVVDTLPWVLAFVIANLARGVALAYSLRDWRAISYAKYILVLGRYLPQLKIKGLLTMGIANVWITRQAPTTTKS
ncbi:MAG: glycosyltransferase family 2 protein [bacterium]|nr:glycosyltransferase family 2 protein [bacterium]